MTKLTYRERCANDMRVDLRGEFINQTGLHWFDVQMKYDMATRSFQFVPVIRLDVLDTLSVTELMMLDMNLYDYPGISDRARRFLHKDFTGVRSSLISRTVEVWLRQFYDQLTPEV